MFLKAQTFPKLGQYIDKTIQEQTVFKIPNLLDLTSEVTDNYKYNKMFT